MDINKDGKINRNELIKFFAEKINNKLTNEETNHIFKYFKSDSSNIINL
jgi:Ca2+-binding EF-hand superfamily protein